MITVLAALEFDLTGDRSFGALMFSTILISIIALACLLIGPWQDAEHMHIALINWSIGTAIVLSITLAFSSLGAEQAKTGELIFVYAALILAFPLSFTLPFAMTLAEPILRGNFYFEVLFAWLICLVDGILLWWLLCYVRTNVFRS